MRELLYIATLLVVSNESISAAGEVPVTESRGFFGRIANYCCGGNPDALAAASRPTRGAEDAPAHTPEPKTFNRSIGTRGLPSAGTEENSPESTAAGSSSSKLTAGASPERTPANSIRNILLTVRPQTPSDRAEPQAAAAAWTPGSVVPRVGDRNPKTLRAAQAACGKKHRRRIQEVSRQILPPEVLAALDGRPHESMLAGQTPAFSDDENSDAGDDHKKQAWGKSEEEASPGTTTVVGLASPKSGGIRPETLWQAWEKSEEEVRPAEPAGKSPEYPVQATLSQLADAAAGRHSPVAELPGSADDNSQDEDPLALPVGQNSISTGGSFFSNASVETTAIPEFVGPSTGPGAAVSTEGSIHSIE
tara:strand:- start:4178 stop:5266 length:1089 start_codon:yes stop_codon:yes gene_type:complete